MHVGELAIDADLVRRLLRAQLPQWADLPLTAVASMGTDNVLFRLGEAFVVRLPRLAPIRAQVLAEQRWLPRLAYQLPLQTPEAVALGVPGEGYPLEWSVVRWIDGRDATADSIADSPDAALDLAGFVAALQQQPTHGLTPADFQSSRGVPLVQRDDAVRAALDELAALDLVDVAAAARAWDRALAAPAWTGPPVWLHGDLLPGNLLVRAGRIVAAIDFAITVGDPACDLMPAWTVLSAATRPVFRSAVASDDPAWRRASGWALSVGLIALPYYVRSNPVSRVAQRMVEEVLADTELS